MSKLHEIVGPRAPEDTTDRWRYWLPSILLGTAAILLVVSMYLPYWRMTLEAPQYPRGLSVQVYVNEMTGDVWEIDGLNHYIGMRPLEEAAQLERAVSVAAITMIALLLGGAIFIHTKWAALLAMPALFFPFVFLADMYFWMRHFGHNLDPTAPLSSAIQPFTPPILGVGVVGQFRTVAAFEPGLYLAFLSSALILIGLYTHRRAYKPLVESGR
jgi:copper chaperone NosL